MVNRSMLKGKKALNTTHFKLDLANLTKLVNIANMLDCDVKELI